VIVEVRRVEDPRGFGYFNQRTKWWKRGTPEPEHWVRLDDRGTTQLPEAEYAIALLVFNAQVEFGSLEISPLQ
jgi:hypothetical protein